MKARCLDGTFQRIIEGVVIGLVVSIILLAKGCFTDHYSRQDEITYIRDLIVTNRDAIASAQAGPVAVLISGSRPRTHHRSREEAQEERWQGFVAELSDVLAYRTSRLTFAEKRELRKHFPGITVDGRKLLGDPLDIIIRNGVRIHYRDIFSQAESISWLDLPTASQDVMDRLVPANRVDSGG